MTWLVFREIPRDDGVQISLIKFIPEYKRLWAQTSPEFEFNHRSV